MSFDSNEFATYLRKHAGRHSQGHCARFVRRALQAGGADTTGHLTDAKTYGPVLMRNGFHSIDVDDLSTFQFVKGDIVVMEPTKHGNQAGHIAGYDGKNWVSDFVQRDFWPGSQYKKETPNYVVYRH